MFGSQMRSRGSAVDDARIWRGRSSELNDVGTLPWAVVMAALELPQSQWSADENPMSRLGLSLGDMRTGEYGTTVLNGATGTRLSGLRHGRQVEIRVGMQDHGWSQRGVMTTWLRVASPAWKAEESKGTLSSTRASTSAVPQAVTDFLSALPAAPDTWRFLQLEGGPDGLVSSRRMHTRTHPQGYLYDLWLLEKLANALAGDPLPAADLWRALVPYRLG